MPGTPTTRWRSWRGWSRRPAAPSWAGRVQRRDHPDPATFFGRGKAAELAESRTEPGYDLLVVDSALSPVQQRNLEKRIDGPVLDRPGLIIEIFGQRARTREARLQVELARLEYLLPRLAGAWSHLERQVGGIGARGGPGERQIELDRRLVRDRISALKRRSPRSGPTARGSGPGAGWGRRWSRWSATPTPASPA